MSSTGKVLPFLRQQPQDIEDGSLSDYALLAACAVGESAALGTLYDRHHIPAFRFVSRISCGGASDVEDLVQCTFIEVWKSAGRFTQKGTVRSWIFGIAANLSKHYIRSEVRRRSALDRYSERPTSPDNLPDETLAHHQLVGRLGEALGTLSYELRVAFVLCDVEDLSGVEAARILDIRKGTLWRRLHDARKKLREMLSKGETL